MRRYLALASVGILALCLAWAGGRMTVPETLAKANVPPQGLGMKFAGGWYFDLYLAGSTSMVKSLVTLNADGAILFNGSPLTDGTTISTAHGSWRCTGPNTMVGTVLCIGYGLDGNVGWYEEGPLNWTLSADGNQLEGTLSIGLFSADQDPLVDDPAYGIVPCNCIGRRIEAE